MAVAVLAVAACGSPNGAHLSSSTPLTAAGSSPTSSAARVSQPTTPPVQGHAASPTRSYPPQRPASPGLLYAVLELPPPLSAPGANYTVAIAGLDGYARAKAHFSPPPGAYVPDAAVTKMPPAYVAAGALYFIDGAGVVRKLQASGANQQVATFPLAATQQVVSFAVSPDGAKIIASVLTLPAIGPLPSPNSGGAPWPPLIGPWKLAIELADSGGPTQTLHQWSSDAGPGSPGGFDNIIIASWDAGGPIAVVGSNVATQNAAFNGQQFFGGHFARIDLATGLPGPQIGSCLGTFTGPFAATPGGVRICADYDFTGATRLTIQSSGQADWQPPVPPSPGQIGDFVADPTAGQLAMDGAVVGRNGTY